MKKTYTKPTFELIKIKSTETVADGSAGFTNGSVAKSFKDITLSELQSGNATFY